MVIFVLLVRVLGGPTLNDSYVLANSTWSIAHGNLACAYPPVTTLVGQPLAPPLYSLFAGVVASVAHIGHQVPFPTAAAMGRDCSNAVALINEWGVQTRSNVPTVMIGYLGWLVLEAAVVVVVRAVGRGRTGWELATVMLAAVTPPVLMCLTEYFHPQDLLSLALLTLAIGAALRRHSVVAGVLVGLAMTSQQFAVLAMIPLLFAVAPRRLIGFVGGVVAAAALVDVPFVLATSGRALSYIVVGTGANSVTPTWLVTLQLGAALHPVARLAPIVGAALLCAWTSRRLGPRMGEPLVLLSLIASSMALRLVFEVNIWGYYFAAVSVLVLLMGAVERSWSPWFFAWLALIVVAVSWGGLINGPGPITPPIWLWQLLLVPPACYFSAAPLARTLRALGDDAPRSVATSS